MPITRPTNYAVPFADSGDKNTIPVAATGSGKASFTQGFPPVTMQPIRSGGVPPEGKDFNGILYDITTHTIWLNAGGQYQFDSALAAEIGGYPIGMVLQSDDGASAYVNAVANNSINFNTTPSSIGNQWMPWAGSALVGNYATKLQVQNGSLVYAVGANSGNAYSAAYTPTFPSLTDGFRVGFKASALNTGASTFSPNGIAAKPILGGALLPLQGGEIVSGGLVTLQYHSTLDSWIIQGNQGGGVQIADASQDQQAITLAQAKLLAVDKTQLYYMGQF